MAKRGAARAVRLNCPKCSSAFTVVAFLSQGIDANQYWKARAEEHDCAATKKCLQRRVRVKEPRTRSRPPRLRLAASNTKTLAVP